MKHIGELIKRLHYVGFHNVTLHNGGLYETPNEQTGVGKYFQEEIDCVGR